jgi:hypothetical protein
MAKKTQQYWQGHPVKDDEHARKLNLRAADLEFGLGHEGRRLPRHEAEAQAKNEDRLERHAQMAAYHLDGMKACHAVGNYKGAEQHYGLYGLHLKQLGRHPIGHVPPEVQRWRDAADKKHHIDFKGGEDDHLLLTGDGHVDVKKTEQERCPGCGSPFESAIGACPHCDDATERHIQGLAEQKVSPGAQKQILDYLRGVGIEGDIAVDVAADYRRGQMRPIQGGGKNPNLASRSHLRVVKAEFLPWLEKTSVLAKASPQPRTPREFAVHKTFLRNKYEPEQRAFDYSAFLQPEQYDQGYRMFVLSHGKGSPVRAHIVHHQMGAGPTWGQRVAGASGVVNDGDLEVQKYHTLASHMNKGLEPAALNAIMHHAKNHMGAYSLSHGEFEPDASALIEAVAKPHGYELGEVEDVPVPEPTTRMTTKPGRQRKPLMVDYGD